MAEYNYVARNKNGQTIEGMLEAKTTNELVDRLHEQGLVVISVNEKIGLDFKSLSEIQIGGISLKERMIVVKQLATMIGAGVPLIQALDVLVQQAESSALKKEFTVVYRNVEGGMTLSKAFSKNSKIFDTLQVNLLEAGEKSGNLVEVLNQVAIDMEKRTALASKIRGAMIYPAIIFIGVIAVVVFMVTFMIPAVRQLYDDLGIEQLPAITEFFVKMSDFLTNPLGAIVSIGIVVALIFGFRAYYSSKGGKQVVDKILLKVPVFGKLIEYSQIVQMTRLLGMLNKSGVSIIESLKTVAKALSNIHYSTALEQAAVDVSKGTTLAASFNKSKVIPFMLLKMISVGEETGTLEKMLEDMSKFYDSELNDMADNLTKLMEPIILVVFGGIVGVLAVAIYLPIYSITQ